MIFVKLNESRDTAEWEHFMPFDPVYGLGKTQAELEQEGVLVDSLPAKDEPAGKVGILKYDGIKLYYEYVDRPLTPEEQLKQLQDQISAQQEAIAELTILLASSTN